MSKPKREVSYEWKLEFMDVSSDDLQSDVSDFDADELPDDDIADVDHCDKLESNWFEDVSKVDGKHVRLVLVRDVGNEDDGLEERSHAYASRRNGVLVLPDEDESGFKVPKKYHQQLERFQVPQNK